MLSEARLFVSNNLTLIQTYTMLLSNPEYRLKQIAKLLQTSETSILNAAVGFGTSFEEIRELAQSKVTVTNAQKAGFTSLRANKFCKWVYLNGMPSFQQLEEFK